jgi:hypothetical protein
MTVESIAAVSGDGGALTVGDPGYRDALYSLLDQEVIGIEIREGESVDFKFEGSKSILVSLRPDDTSGPDAVTFSSGTGGFWVW